MAIVAIFLFTSAAHFAAVGQNRANGTDANAYGHVIDRHTGEHQPYVTVAVVGTPIGTTTDASGHYFLHDLPTGEITVEVSAVGYKTASRTITVTPDSTIELNFELEESRIAVDAVVVSANRNETSRREAPSLVNIIDAKIFDTANAACIAQGLSFQPGVRVEDDCQNCGFAQVRINTTHKYSSTPAPYFQP